MSDPLVLELEIDLENDPPTGRLRTRGGAEATFTGWLAFVAALGRLDHAARGGIQPKTTTGAPMSDRPILITGATGKTGRRVAERLTALGVPVRLGSRSASLPFDWERPATWEPVLEGAGAAYLSYYPDLAVPGAADTVGSLAAQAVRQGVRRLVLLAGRGEPEAEVAEEAVRESGADLTVLRATWFAQNFSEGYLLDAVLAGSVAMPAGDVPEPFVDADDIADVAVAALTHPGHIGETYELTGPRLLTFADAVAEISRATGRSIEYVPVPVEEFAMDAAEQGVPSDVVDLLVYLFTEVLDGRNAHVAGGVERALGRPPRDFAEFARKAAASGVWKACAPAQTGRPR